MANPLQIYEWNDGGYRPLVINPNWQVALLNWEPLFEYNNMNEIERHNETDEIFVLINGKALLFTCRERGLLYAEVMKTGVVYNVPKGVWHNLLATRDVSILIVEDSNTHIDDTEIRPISEAELASLAEQMPQWVK